VLITPD